MYRAPILSGLAEAYVVNEPLEKADVVVAMGGGLQYRTFEAARLYHAGLANKVLIIRSKLAPTDLLGLTEPERDVFRKVLLKKAVPETAIVAVGNDCTTSWEDAVAVRDWMLQNGAHKLIVPTDIFHTRRARWLGRLSSARITYGVKKTHTNRVAATTVPTANAYQASSPAE